MGKEPPQLAATGLGQATADQDMRVPTSAVLEGLLEDAPPDQVTLNWILDSLRARSFGIVMLLLGATLLAPIPFSHVIPALVVMLLAFAFLEEDGVLLYLALAAAVLSLAVTAAAVWGTIEASLLLRSQGSLAPHCGWRSRLLTSTKP